MSVSGQPTECRPFKSALLIAMRVALKFSQAGTRQLFQPELFSVVGVDRQQHFDVSMFQGEKTREFAAPIGQHTPQLPSGLFQFRGDDVAQARPWLLRTNWQHHTQSVATSSPTPFRFPM